MFSSFVSFIGENAGWYGISFYGAIFMYILYAIGWFFSTDYFDNYIKSFEDPDDIGGFTMFITIILAASGFCVVYFGYTSNVALGIYSVFWMIFVLPVIICNILNYREVIRKKRGKS